MFILGVTFIRYVYWTSLRFILFLHHSTDSGIYTMMFIEHWTSPRSALRCLFTQKDIPNIRIKIANDLVFQPKNSGMKHRVTHYKKVVCPLSLILEWTIVSLITKNSGMNHRVTQTPHSAGSLRHWVRPFFLLPVLILFLMPSFFCRTFEMTAQSIE